MAKLRMMAVTFLTLGALSLTGCQNIHPTTLPNESGFAGGDGVYGENPANPGAYGNIHQNLTPPSATADIR
jgi:hypothetical protein